MPLSSEALKNARIRSGLSQNQAAEKLHVTRQTISRWETGKGYPSMDSLADIADLYNVPYEILFDKEPRDLNDLPRFVFSSKYSVYALLFFGVGGFILNKLSYFNGLDWLVFIFIAFTAAFDLIILWEAYWNIWGKVRHNKKKIAKQEQLEREQAAQPTQNGDMNDE